MSIHRIHGRSASGIQIFPRVAVAHIVLRPGAQRRGRLRHADGAGQRVAVGVIGEFVPLALRCVGVGHVFLRIVGVIVFASCGIAKPHQVVVAESEGGFAVGHIHRAADVAVLVVDIALPELLLVQEGAGEVGGVQVVAVIIGGNLMGIMGMFLFIPLTSIFYTLFKTYVKDQLKK